MYKNMRYFAPILTLVLLTCGVTAWMHYYSSTTVLETMLIETQITMAREVKNTILNSLKITKNISEIVANNPDIINLLRDKTPVGLLKAKQVLDITQRQNPSIYNITIFDTNGAYLIANLGGQNNVANQEYFKQALHNLPSVNSMLAEVSGVPTFLYIKPIKLGNTVIGVLRTAFNLEVLKTDWNAILPQGSTYFMRVVDSSGSTLTCSCPTIHGILTLKNHPIEKVLSKEPLTLVEFDDEGETRLGSYMPIPNTDWSIIISVGKDKIYASADRLFSRSVIINILVSLIVIIAIIVLLHQLINTIHALEVQNHGTLLEAKAKLEKLVDERTATLNEQNQLLTSQYQNLTNLLESSPVCISISTCSGHLLYTNPALHTLLGDVAMNNPQAQYPDPYDRKKISEDLIKGEIVHNRHVTMYGANNELCQIQLSASLIEYNGQKAELRWFVDVTDTFKVKDVLEKEQALLRAIFDTIPDLVFYKGSNGKYLGCNKAFADFCGYSVAEIVGKSDAEVFNYKPEDVNAFLEADQRSMELQSSIRFEELCTASDGTQLLLETIKAPCCDEKGNTLGILGISRDMNERKQIERDLITAREQAQAANRAKSDFIANMSHEIRTPMNGIMGLSHLALQMDIHPQLRNYVTKIDASAKSLLRIINDILDFSKIDAGKMEMETIPFQLEMVLENAIQPLMPSIAEKNLELFFDIENNIQLSLLGDPIRLGQIIMNLISNAVKFTHKGNIVITISTETIDSNQVCLRFSITDTGIGIDTEKLEQLFESFTQADSSITRRYGGTGLGLTICKSLVQLMGGKITVTSELGKGSVFSFTAFFGIHHITQLKTVNSNINPLKILIIDDNEISRQILRSNLNNFGAITTEAESGELALDLFTETINTPDYFDVIIVDWKMPGIDGIETARRIANIVEPHKVPTVIMVTAHERELILRDAQDVGIKSVLTKPVTPSSLYDVIVGLQEQYDLESSDLTIHGSRFVAQPVKQEQTLLGKKVLLVEDNEINQLIASEMLTSYGVTVTLACTGVEAFDLVQKNVFDAILMDIQMPEMDGIEATKLIRNNPDFDSIPIIAMTAHAMAGDYEKSIQAGMQAHITKPIDPEELYSTLNYWMLTPPQDSAVTQA